MPTNISNIKDKGGNKISLAELDENYLLPGHWTAGVNCIDLGHIASSQLEMKTARTKFKNEAGEPVSTEHEFEGITTAVLMETDKEKADFLAFRTRNRKYLEYKYLGIKGGKHQESFKIAEVTPQMKMASPGGTKSLQYESSSCILPSDFVISTQGIIDFETALGINIRTAGPVTIAARTEHVIIETPVV